LITWLSTFLEIRTTGINYTPKLRAFSAAYAADCHPEPTEIRSFCLLVRHRERSVAICLSAFLLEPFASYLCPTLGESPRIGGEGPFHSLRKTKEQRRKADCHTVLLDTLMWMD